MPHMIIEHSDSILWGDNVTDLLADCHEALVDLLPTVISSCKSRFHPVSVYHVGDRSVDPARVFIAVRLRVMAGRSEETLQKTGRFLFDKILNYVQPLNPDLSIDLSVEVGNLDSVYLKA